MKTVLPNFLTRDKIGLFHSALYDTILSSPKSRLENRVEKEYSQEFMERLVVEFQSSDESIEVFCARNNISVTLLSNWTSKLLSLEEESYLSFFTEIDQTKEPLIDFIDEIFKKGKSFREVSREYDLSYDSLLSWSKEYWIRNSYRRNFKLHHHNVVEIDKIREDLGARVLNYLNSFLDLSSVKTNIFFKSESALKKEGDLYENIILLSKANNERFLNKHFEKVNSLLQTGGIFIGCFETLKERRLKSFFSGVPLIGEFYFGIEFVFKRIFPKLSFTKWIYFKITKGRNRLISKAEGLGRLVSCGYRIIDFHSINGLLYFVVQKTSSPTFDMNPSYGPIFGMKRIGKNGKIFKVYKFRTMHPYSEYLQDYMVKAYGYAESGKPANDFRIPGWGKFMRKFWLDETPQLFNVLKGEMKLVGIRPVSELYFKDIPLEMQKLRVTQKPGCIPPYVALNKKGDVMSVLQAESIYIQKKIANPYLTDIKFFFGALFNIIFRHKRSA